MSEHALPCLICGKQLRNVFADAGNQPYDGVVLTTSGNYGSTVYDSFTGEFLEVNVCDPCLTRAGEQGRVLEARTRRPATLNGTLVGWEEMPYTPVPWTAGMPGDGKGTLDLWEDELDTLPATIHLDATPAALRMALDADD